MDKVINLSNNDELTQKVNEFADQLQCIGLVFSKKDCVQSNQLMELLLLCTEIEEQLAANCKQCQLPNKEVWASIQQLSELDERFRKIGQMIALHIDLEKWQNRADIK
ncbi:hypothetical protein [Candidatus Albibeggiatoa sp. nov. NOAA]|uniref:hypothetical protein n=1 Tax=Candidatus Albibeggiatoa sp. nov. NOAA TaxID=3162724 RepID=UPI0032F7879B|nr:hypothetical protein [Thiotrichaceae bacterium]